MSFSAGQTLTADDINAAFTNVTELFVVKSADETVTSSTTLQNDDHLFLTPLINTTYDLELCIFTFVGGSIIDVSAAFTFPAGATLSMGAFSPDNTLGAGATVGPGQWINSVGDTSSPSAAFVFGSGSNVTSMIKGTLLMGATAGVLHFQWAQAASSAAPLSVLAGSYLRLTPH